MTTVGSIIGHLDALDRGLAAKRFPLISPWWRATLVRFYASGRRQLVLRCGRRGGKSSSLCRVAVLEALFGEHEVPPGDVGVVAIISVSRDEANQRLRTIKAILDALGITYKPIENGIELTSKAFAFKIFTASIAGVSGFTCIAAICDEVAKWRDSESGANPAKEVLASLRPTMATQPRARIFLSSSPMGTTDAHALAFVAGDDSFQVVAHAETWIANPTISEGDTHALEPDDRIWRREYAAIPQAGVLGAFDSADIDRAFAARDYANATRAQRILVLDVSSGKKDSWTWGLCGWNTPPDPALSPYLAFDSVDGIDGESLKTVNAADLVARLAILAKQKKVLAVFGDQREEFLVRSTFAKHSVNYSPTPWTAQSKPKGVETVRRWLREGVLALPAHDRLKREMQCFEERITPAGSFTFGARGSGHDDFVALLISAALVQERGHLPAPPKRAEGVGSVRASAPVATFNYSNGGIWGGGGLAATSAELVNSMRNGIGRR